VFCACAQAPWKRRARATLPGRPAGRDACPRRPLPAPAPFGPAQRPRLDAALPLRL